ncbi:hypothetical protein L1987_12947 [Smallanthus sonchifolius]|uniref:Uncharacterized protein n=1 Tax=Smallanthus sonchifolius TaxID=185202 RepID=A0ACB9JHJ3_9ASTR|nr:hypothetical protein L1987_12947 [Smallanthus sonchifolius]
MRVRERILVLIDTWQEAFGGRGGKLTAQYHHAYQELRAMKDEFNDILQYIIEKHDAIASGSPVPVKPPSLLTRPLRIKQTEVKPKSSIAASASISNEIQEEPIDSALIATSADKQLRDEWAQTRPQLEYVPQPPLQTVEQPPNYIPPPWAPTPGYYCSPYASNYSASTYYNNGSSSGAGLNPYIPSYRLFEDLNVLGNMRTSGAPGAGTSGQCMLGNRK